MSTSFKVITPPTTEPISVALVRDWLRVDWFTEDEVLSALITQARSYAETVTHRALATQVIRQEFTIERPIGGDLSGAINPGPSWYEYSESIGANPFGPSQFYFDIVSPPIQASQPFTIETRITAFEPWVTFTGTTFLDDNAEPARIYIMTPITANFYRFTFTAGYDQSTYLIPPDLKQCLLDLCVWFYDNRDGQVVPQSITNRLLSKRVDWM